MKSLKTRSIYLVITLTLLASCQQKESTHQKQTTTISPNASNVKQCPTDTKNCPNGRFVSRNIENNCEFDPCRRVPHKAVKTKTALNCTDDVKECSDGTFMGRDPYNKCEFKLCPPDKNGRSEHTDN